MMPGIFENSFDEEPNYDLSAPVVSLKNGLPVSELLSKHQTEFEVRPDEDELVLTDNSPESCFDFDKLEEVINLDLIDIDQSEDGEDSTPFDKYRRKMHNLRDDGKIKKYVVKQGVGSLVPDNCIVYIRYQAYVEYQEMPFDSTLWQCNSEGNFPVPVNLGKGQLLLGLHEAILSMRKGEKAEFLIHPDLAYGKLGCAPRIPQDATVLFIVEVDRFVDCGDIHSTNDDLNWEERQKYSNVNKIARGHYLIGNDLFQKQNYSASANKYRQVINMMHNARLANEEEENERNRFLIKNYTNAAICYHKLKNYKRVCIMGADAMQVNETEARRNCKLLYFWGYAKMMLGDYSGSKRHLLAAKKLQPSDREIANALKELEKKENDALIREKVMMRKAFNYQPAPQAQITEIDEAEERFRKIMSEQLQEFKDNSEQDSLFLRDRYTVDEEKICVQVAKEMGLYARVIDGEKRIIHIKKPVDM